MTADRTRGTGGAVDLAVVAVLVACGVVGLGPSFAGSGYLRAAGLGMVAGLAVAWVGARLRWSVLAVTAATVVAYLVLGGAAALSGTTLGGVVPTLPTLRGLALGAVTAWKDLLTLTPPLDAFPAVLVVPFVATLVAGVVGGSLALRARRPAWAVLPPAVVLVLVIALGTQEAALPLAQGAVIAGVALTWTAWRRAGARAAASRDTRSAVEPGARRLGRRRTRNAVALLVAVGALTAVAAPTLAPDTYRHVLRDVVHPPLDLRQYPSPLAGYRKYVKDLEDEVLFTVTGLPEGARLRLATLDAYTGTVLDVAGGDPGAASASGAFSRVGASLPQPDGGPTAADERTVQIQVVGYRGVWLPTVGVPASVTFQGGRSADLESSLFYNPDTGSALTTTPLTEGDSYAVVARQLDVSADPVAERPTIADLPLPVPRRAPDSVATTAESLVDGATDPWTQLTKIRDELTSSGVFSDGLEGEAPSRAGHGTERIETLLVGRRMIGDDEQFAVAMTLMARALGIPARVVMGFYPDGEAAGEAVDVTGTDVHAWVEVPVESASGVRWVSLDPTPDEDQEPQQQDPRSSSKPEPQVLQEPPPPEVPAEPPLQPVPDAAENDPVADEPVPWGRYLGIAGAVSVPIVLLMSPFALVLVAKSRRRRDRRHAPDPVDRLSGGWREVVDAAVDLGDVVPASATRRETAVALAGRYPGSSPRPVADMADAAVFGTGEPSEHDVEAFWGEVERLITDLTGSVGRWRRLRARFSPRSLSRGRGRRRTRGEHQ